MNWNTVKLWIANLIGFFFANPIFAYAVFGLILAAIVFGVITSQNCGGGKGIDNDRIQKQSRENEKRKKEELNNVFNSVNKRIENAETEVNKAKSRDLSNQNNKNLESEIERKAKQF